MIQNVLVVGGGSAGFLAAITLKTRLPELSISVVRSPEIGVIGVGESTVSSVVTHLHGYLGLDPKDFFREARPIWKLGIYFLWGQRPWFFFSFGFQLDTRYRLLPREPGYYIDDDPTSWDDCGENCALSIRNKAFLRAPNGDPIITPSHAYHLENKTFVAWLERHALRMGITVHDGTVAHVEQGPAGVAGVQLEDGRRMSGDLYVDCTGFRSLLLGKTLGEPYRSFASSLYCDSAVVGGWERQPGEPTEPYTTVEAMECGWCWRIDHQDLVNRGYVYSSSFITDAAAEQEFRIKNPRITETRVIRFRTGRYERAWVKNVIAIGNSNGFVEPLESTGVAALCSASQNLAEILADSRCEPTDTLVKLFNLRNAKAWDGIRKFLALHYKFNTRIDNAFWRECWEKADLAGAEPVVEFYRQNGPTSIFKRDLIELNDPFSAEGYLSLLLGMNLPYEHKYQPSASERDLWNQIRAAHRRKAEQALTTEEALEKVNSDAWQWNRGFFRPYM